MNNVITFKTKDKVFTLTVKEDFLTACKNPSDFVVSDLIKDYNVISYLHNENGPAVTRHKPPQISEPLQKLIDKTEYFLKYNDDGDRIEYWLDGRLVSREDPTRAEKMSRNINFKKVVNEILDEEKKPV